jgi:hypothetical protein
MSHRYVTLCASAECARLGLHSSDAREAAGFLGVEKFQYTERDPNNCEVGLIKPYKTYKKPTGWSICRTTHNCEKCRGVTHVDLPQTVLQTCGLTHAP